MKDYRNFVIVNTNNFIVTATFANCSSDVLYKKYARNFPTKKNVNNNVDILKILNKHLAQILKWKDEEQALNIYHLLIPPKLCKIIKDKMYKQWLITKKNSAGFNLKPEELEQWEIFDKLYKAVFTDVSFKPNNLYNTNDINKSYKHVVFTKAVLDKIYVYINKLEDSVTIKTLDDLVKHKNN